MRIWQGKPVSPGYAEGRALVYRSGGSVTLPRRAIAPERADAEIGRFREAIEATRRDVEALRARAADELGGPAAAIFAFHAGALTDDALTRGIEERIAKDLLSPENAVEAGIADLARRFSALDDDYFRERAADVRDLGRRIMGHLLGRGAPVLDDLPDGTVLVADELLPSDTLHLDRAHVRAIVAERCGRTSHAAILAKALGIPAVCLDGAASRIRTGTKVLVNGVAGTVTSAPTRVQSSEFLEQRGVYDRELSSARLAEQKPCATVDGVPIRLMANIGRVAEADAVGAYHLEGIGLFRTEILFLDSPVPPSVETQCEAYRRVAETIDGRPLVIRTLDLGGDKHPAFLPVPSEHDAALRLRGLRFSLRERTLLRTQLAAIARVARSHPVHVLFPMVLGGDDLDAAMEVLREEAREEGLPDPPPAGAMIETPSAVFAIDDIARRATFLSIGTNDLTQFMLVADRGDRDLIDDYSLLHPSVLRAVRHVVERASAAGRSVTVCGEAAGDPQLVPVLVGLGVRELSMSPARSAPVRHAIERITAADARDIVQELLACESLEANKDRVAAGPWARVAAS